MLFWEHSPTILGHSDPAYSFPGGMVNMFFSHQWRSKTALTMAMAIASTATLPLLMATRASAAEPTVVAQVFSQPGSRVGVPAGTVIPVTFDKDKIVVTPDETSEVTLTITTDVRSSRGTVIIPSGSKLEGQLEPANGGSQFVARQVVFPSGRSYPIDAESQVVTRRETISERSNPDILRGAAIGAAAGAILAEIFGDIDLGEVLAGAGLGALASVFIRGRREVEVVVVYPEQDLDVTLQSDFVLTSSLLR
jgi:hypothetical protein